MTPTAISFSKVHDANHAFCSSLLEKMNGDGPSTEWPAGLTAWNLECSTQDSGSSFEGFEVVVAQGEYGVMWKHRRPGVERALLQEARIGLSTGDAAYVTTPLNLKGSPVYFNYLRVCALETILEVPRAPNPKP